jgi:small subunit ribosomal protein S4
MNHQTHRGFYEAAKALNDYNHLVLCNDSNRAARQLVSHCHIVLNGETMNIPSTLVKPGDVIGVRERSKSLEVVQNSLAGAANKYSWLEWDSASMSGKFLNAPERTEVPETINEQLIVELYSK